MTNNVPNIPLAGLGLDKDTLLHVARLLLADIYWNDEREGDYLTACALKPKKFPFVRELMKRPETPQVADELDALMKLSHICGRIEQSWGTSFYDVSRRMVKPDQVREKVQQTLIYRTIMACIGHGISAADSGDFPDDLDPSPIIIENPMQYQLDLLE